jgi:hypothetical protein
MNIRNLDIFTICGASETGVGKSWPSGLIWAHVTFRLAHGNVTTLQGELELCIFLVHVHYKHKKQQRPFFVWYYGLSLSQYTVAKPLNKE